jgi:hypothetical protein
MMSVCLQVSSQKAIYVVSLSLQLSIWIPPTTVTRGNEKFIITNNKYIVDIF